MKRKKVYRLCHDHPEGDSQKLIGYFSTCKKARDTMKYYRSNVTGFKDYPNGFVIDEIEINKIYNINKYTI